MEDMVSLFVSRNKDRSHIFINLIKQHFWRLPIPVFSPLTPVVAQQSPSQVLVHEKGPLNSLCLVCVLQAQLVDVAPGLPCHLFSLLRPVYIKLLREEIVLFSILTVCSLDSSIHQEISYFTGGCREGPEKIHQFCLSAVLLKFSKSNLSGYQ